MRSTVIFLIAGIACCIGGYLVGTAAGLALLAVGVLLVFAGLVILVPSTESRPPTHDQPRTFVDATTLDRGGERSW